MSNTDLHRVLRLKRPDGRLQVVPLDPGWTVVSAAHAGLIPDGWTLSIEPLSVWVMPQVSESIH